MAYTISADISAILDGQQIDAADVTTPIGNLKTAIQDLGNGVSAPEVFRFAQISTPSAPAAGSNLVYFKSGDIPYMQGSGVAEKMLGASHLITPRTVMGADATSVTISSIPATFSHLLLILEPRTDVAATTDNILLRFNADATAGNYYSQIQNNLGTTTATAETLGSGLTGINIPCAVGSTGSTGNGRAWVLIPNYASTTMRRGIMAICYSHGANTSSGLRLSIAGGDWTNATTAVSSITLVPNSGANIKQNSAYTLYGMS